ncbi:G-type lectin S-receptor-like serine/threonine-protein kinase LECRK1 [Quercus suber]|uniref:G-type lectin S-receptor-like serine/threonine-protein kinase LECRK1 n=1 Tax=Quercus suber TaxID=58331 RepID=UPI000CE1C682|nr:G-type lectin S-receptor-like serine/threonine-protein kinase LECRK1 [Quercus suber]POF23564.1 g-type lectin s-receptor-like serine/threonine-protein kinase lecrk1 [Quercus suber]
MGSISVLFLLSMCLLAFDVKAQLQRNHSGNVIPLGSWLSPIANRTSWLSPSGLFAFGFYPQGKGFAIGIWLHTQPNNTIVWTANPDNLTVSSNTTLNLTSDGILLLRTEKGEENFMNGSLEVIPAVSAVSASMHNSGNFVLYDNFSTVIWQSFDNPTDTILGGQNFSYGSADLVSRSDHSGRRYHLTMDSKGNLVSYLAVNGTDDSENAYWSLDTFYGSSVILRLNQRGLLRLTNESSTLIILVNNSYPGKKETSIIYRAILDSDGIFKLYSHHFDFGGNTNTISKVSLEWSSLRDQCEVKGFCGFNSYCIGIGSKAECQCYSGFHFMNPKNKLLGCYSNFNEDGCSKGPMIPYDIIALRNISWGDFPYSVILTKQENCYKSCLGDCNCNAAFYMNGTCNKYKLPLKYGRSQNLSSIAFFKVIWRNAKISYHQPPIPEILMESKKMMILILSLTLGSIALMCSVIAISCFFMYRHQVHRYRKLSPENVNVEIAENFTLRSFSYNELENATDGFKEALSKGSFGSVYKGYVSEANKTIAVKRLEKSVEEGEREFRAEMTVIGRTHHRNIVQLLGFCIEGSRKLLVYEYMCNGSLADLLFKATKRPLWKERVRIALEVARGVFYLHQECEVHIIHCNLKPQSILMDDTWTAKISDFGLARLSVPNQMKIVMGIEGTSEYSAPEWQKNGLISVKADIYSFGVLLLEIVCCRHSIEVNVLAADEILISNWVYNCLVAGQLDKLVEDENVDVKTLERMVKVGLWCIQDDPALRPPMKNVILMLEGTMSIAIPPSPAISHS